MLRELTNNQLLALARDIQAKQNESASFFYFNLQKIQNFFKYNQFLLNVIEKKMNGFIEKYVVHDEKGVAKSIEKDGQMVYVFAEPEDEESYLLETKEFLSRVVKVQL